MKLMTIIAGAATMAVVLSAAPANAHHGSSHRQEMQSTGADADARGVARLHVRDVSDGRLEIRVKGLAASAPYEVVVAGVRVGAFTTYPNGAARIRFRSRPRSSHDQLLGFDPRGAIVVIRDAAGADVLTVMIPATAPGEGDEVICCVPDDDGAECEDRTADECVARGGTVSTATSCLPSPCADVPPPPGSDIVCCIPDDDANECEDRTPAECAAQGGIPVSATSCANNPCAPIPPNDTDIRCCLPNYYQSVCEDRTPSECAAQGGVDLGAGACAADTCAGVVPPDDGGGASVRVRCEKRSDRSRISVDGSGLAAGSYNARVISGANQVTSPAQTANGDEAEFDFDSDGGDIGEGSTPIGLDFLQGNPPQATGQILDANGNLVVESTVTCELN